MTLLETARDQTSPRLIQLTIFLPNRVGALLAIVRSLEDENIRLCAISILDSADHAVIRLVVDRPDVAEQFLRQHGHEVFRTEILGVVVPPRDRIGPRRILAALITAEVNVHYMYSLMTLSNSRPVVALCVDDVGTAVKVFRTHGVTLVGQDEIDG